MSTSLDRFHDLLIPAPIGLFPLAEGWYMLLALLVAISIYLGVRSLRAYLRNTYRREALDVFRSIQSIDDEVSRSHRLLELLRRTALAAYGREKVAGLEGDSWWGFLDESRELFTAEHARAVSLLLYSDTVPSSELLISFEKACEAWIREHERDEHDHV